MRNASAEGRLLRLCADVLFLCAVVCDEWEVWLAFDFELVVFFDVLLALCVVEVDVFFWLDEELDVFFWLDAASEESARTGATRTSTVKTLANARTAAVAKTGETGDFIESI